MPGITEEGDGDEVKVFKTSEKAGNEEEAFSKCILMEDKADIAFQADVEGPEDEVASTSTEERRPLTDRKPAAAGARGTHSTSVLSPSGHLGSKSGASVVPPSGGGHVVNGNSLGSGKHATAFAPASKHSTVPSTSNGSLPHMGTAPIHGLSLHQIGSIADGVTSNNNNNHFAASYQQQHQQFLANLSQAASAGAPTAPHPASMFFPSALTPNGSTPVFLPLGTYSPAALAQPFAGMPAGAASPFWPSPFRLGAGAPGTPTTPVGGAGLTPLSLDAAAKLGGCSPSFTSPYFPAGLSPSYDLSLQAAAASMAGGAGSLARFASLSPMVPGFQSAASPANLSPLQSPTTGTPIVPGAPKADVNSPAQQMRFNKDLQALFNQGGVSLPRNFPAFQMNPLVSMASVQLPRVTTTVTSLAANLAQGSHPALAHQNGMRKQDRGGSLSRSFKDSKADKQTHIKKPLNAFMIFMKENRQKLMEEKGYKERQSAELNKELGRLWHTLNHEEQQKYYAIAREERQRHMVAHPGWSARDNYAINKKRKRKRDKNLGDDNLELKKCRARFGLDKQSQWCKHCKRKKKCLWFRDGGPVERPPGASNGSQEHAERSPVQVTSTTQGSPSDGGDPRVPGGGASSSSSTSPNAVSSTLLPHHQGHRSSGDGGSSSGGDSDEDDDDDDDVMGDDVIDEDDDVHVGMEATHMDNFIREESATGASPSHAAGRAIHMLKAESSAQAPTAQA